MDAKNMIKTEYAFAVISIMSSVERLVFKVLSSTLTVKILKVLNVYSATQDTTSNLIDVNYQILIVNNSARQMEDVQIASQDTL